MSSEELVPYFAIGSMINPISLGLREIKSSQSFPGILYNYVLKFEGALGMANISYQKGGHFHGVLHYVTPDMMVILDRIEGSYSRITVPIHLYNGEVRDGTVYIMDPVKFNGVEQVDNLPQERYIDIIVRGCRHFGIKEEYIQWLQQQPCIPRKKPCEYSKVCVPSNPIYITKSELSKYNGYNGMPLYIGLNGKVIKFVGDADDPKGHPAVNFSYAQANWGGQDYTFISARTLYEPMFPLVNSRDEMTQDHCDYVEDLFCMMADVGVGPNVWECIGYLIPDQEASTSSHAN